MNSLPHPISCFFLQANTMGHIHMNTVQLFEFCIRQIVGVMCDFVCILSYVVFKIYNVIFGDIDRIVTIHDKEERVIVMVVRNALCQGSSGEGNHNHEYCQESLHSLLLFFSEQTAIVDGWR